MIAQPTKCPHFEGSSSQQKIGKNWVIASPTKCPQFEGSSNQQKIGKLDDRPTNKMPPFRRF